jgi:two-component sensor histidine kinase
MDINKLHHDLKNNTEALKASFQLIRIQSEDQEQNEMIELCLNKIEQLKEQHQYLIQELHKN